MNKLKNLYALGGLVVIVLLALGLWIKHDADATAADYIKQRDALTAQYKKDAAQLNVSTLVHSEDAELAPKQRAVCNQAKALREKLTTNASPRSSILGIGGALSSRYSSAEKKATEVKSSTRQAVDSLHTYDAICDYYVTDNEYSQRYDAVEKTAEYKAQLNFNPPSCNNDTGCISKEHYASFAPLYEKKIPILKERNAKFKDIKCPFDAADQKVICDKISQVRQAMEQGDTQYVAALRAGDTQKLAQLAGKDSDVSRAVKDMDDYARKLDPAIPSTEGATMYFTHQFANLEKKLQSITV